MLISVMSVWRVKSFPLREKDLTNHDVSLFNIFIRHFAPSRIHHCRIVGSSFCLPSSHSLVTITMPTSSPASSRVQTPSDAGTFGVDNSDIVPKDSPFYNAGLVDGFPAKISAYTPTVRRIITPANMLSVYKCELVYPSLQNWGVLPNGRMSRAWRPLGYK